MKKIFPLLAVFSIAGCATTFVSPDSRGLPDSRIALIKAGNRAEGRLGLWTSRIHNVYGIKGQIAPTGGGTGNYKSVRLAPGKYTVYLYCQYNNIADVNTTLYSSSDVPVDIDVQPGMTYFVSCKFISHSRMIAIVAGSYRTGSQMGIIPGKNADSNTDNQENLDDLKGLVSPGQN